MLLQHGTSGQIWFFVQWFTDSAPGQSKFYTAGSPLYSHWPAAARSARDLAGARTGAACMAPRRCCSRRATLPRFFSVPITIRAHQRLQRAGTARAVGLSQGAGGGEDLSRAAAQGDKLLERQLAALASSTGFHGRLFPAARAAGVSAGNAVRQRLRLPSGGRGQL
jgi:hypothetical protein